MSVKEQYMENSNRYKFRAWTGEKMTNVIRLESAHGIRLVSSSYLSPHEMSDDKVVFMQYTGLKDKNGVEVWEGDVVKNNEEIWDIYYSEGAWKMGRNGKRTDNDHLFLLEPGYSEVIGNIYQNEELLK